MPQIFDWDAERGRRGLPPAPKHIEYRVSQLEDWGREVSVTITDMQRRMEEIKRGYDYVIRQLQRKFKE